MASNESDPDFRRFVDAAAAGWYSQQSTPATTIGQPPSTQNDTQQASNQRDEGPVSVESTAIQSDVNAWESALRILPDDFRDTQLPQHPLAQILAMQPVLRHVEWNQHRQQGSFVPRTPHDYSSLMIYLSGQVNPNPCRNCRLRNGPFAKCIVAPPSVLAQSTLKHACANCTYQNQYKKCNNAPISDHELARSQIARTWIPKASSKTNSQNPVRPPISRPRKPREEKLRADKYGHNQMSEPAAPPVKVTLVDSFAEKVRQARSWSPRSRRRMEAEILQWQAAIATVEAEKMQSLSSSQNVAHSHPTPRLPVDLRLPSFSAPTSSAVFAAPTSVNGGDAGGYPEVMDEDDSDEEDEEPDHEGPSWVGFEDTGPVVKAPR